MKTKIIALTLAVTLSMGCGSAKNIDNIEVEPKKEVVSGEHDPIMKLLVSGLIILSVNFLFTK